MAKDIADRADDDFDKSIERAMAAFGKEVAQRSAARQDYVIQKLRQEIERVRPFTERLLQGKSQTKV